MTLQARDLNILAALLRYKYLASGQLDDLFFRTGSTAVKQRRSRIMRRLQAADLVKQQFFPRTTHLKGESLYYLTDSGARTLAAEWGVSLDHLGYKRIVYPLQSLNYFYHKRREIDFWIRLDADVARSACRLKTVVTDGERITRDGDLVVKTHINTRDDQVHLVPDLYFILVDPDGRECLYFVEIDTGKETIGGRFQTIPGHSLLAKYQRYETIMADRYWKELLPVGNCRDAFEVLTVTERVSHIQGIYRQAGDAVHWKHLFLLSTHTMIQTHGILPKATWVSLATGQRRPLNPGLTSPTPAP